MKRSASAGWWGLATIGIGAFAVVRTWSYQMSFWPMAAAAAGVTLLSIALLAIGQGRPRAVPTPLIAVIVGASALLFGCGVRVSAVLAMNTMVVPWSLLSRRPWNSLPPADRSGRIPVVGLNIAAAILAMDRYRSVMIPMAVVLLGAAVCVVSAYSPASTRSLQAGIERFARAVATAVTVPLLALVWFLAVLVPWLPQQLLRSDPSQSPTGRSPGWIPLVGGGPEPQKMWAPDRSSLRLGRGDRLRSAGSSALTFLILAGGLAGLTAAFTHLPFGNPDDAAGQRPDTHEPLTPMESVVGKEMESQDWWPELIVAMSELNDNASITQFTGVEFSDMESPYLNIVDGRRITWRPGTDGCGTPVKVWMFGGSTLFGVGMRDEHTLASALAKAASRSGLNLQIENFGVPGDVAWQENRRMVAALSHSQERPELVVFYDGFNDLQYTDGMSYSDRGAPGDFIGPLDRLQMPALEELKSIDNGDRLVVEVPPVTGSEPRADDLIVAAAAGQYSAAHDEATRLLSTYDIPMLRFHQPSQRTRAMVVDGEMRVDERNRKLGRGFLATLPSDVVDLSHVFDDVPGPVYNDAVHTAESSNDLVAASMLDALIEANPWLSDRIGAPCS